jgi:hypothetical protein
MKIGLSPRVKLFHTHDVDPPSPQRWSVSEMITARPFATGGFSS